MRSRTPDVLHFLLTIILAITLVWSLFQPKLTAEQAAQLDAGFRSYRYLAAPMTPGGPPRYETLEKLLVQQPK